MFDSIQAFSRTRDTEHGKGTLNMAQARLETSGALLDWGWRYDLMIWGLDLLLGGKLTRARSQALDLARLQPGDRVLDVGCGTGALAMEAARRVGPSGEVVGIDPAPRQIARARAQAARRNVAVDFRPGVIERLEFGDASFDAALSMWMLHHLPDDLKTLGLAEIARVLKPDGRLVIVDGEHPRHGGRGRLGVGHVGIDQVRELLRQAGFARVDKVADLRLGWLHGLPRASFVLAQRGTSSQR